MSIKSRVEISDFLYVYDVTEQSVDVRRYRVESDSPLSKEILRSIYHDVVLTHSNSRDTSKLASIVGGNEVKTTSTFLGTEYGDDCQTEISNVYLTDLQGRVLTKEWCKSRNIEEMDHD
jgi:hypothetical protein